MDGEEAGWPNADADGAKVKGEEPPPPKAGVLPPPKGDDPTPNAGADCCPNAPVVLPKAGVLATPKAGADCCPKILEVVEPKAPAEVWPNAGVEPKVPNGEDAPLPKAGVDAAPNGPLDVVTPNEDEPPNAASHRATIKTISSKKESVNKKGTQSSD